MKALKQLEERDIAHQLEGLRFSLHGVALAFQRIQKFTTKREVPEPVNPKFEEYFDVLNNCWVIIDQTDRARGLVESISGFQKKAEQKRAFLKISQKARDFRNLYHHLGPRAKSIPDNGTPIMGSLSWAVSAEPAMGMTMFLASGAVASSIPSLTFDRLESRFVENFVFNVAGKQISLEELANACGEFSAFIETLLEKHGIHDVGDIGGMIFRFSFQDISELG